MIRTLVLALALLLPVVARAGDEPPLLLRKPAVNHTQIVFCYADDLWSVPREGGDARRLTSSPGLETDPVYSPDGKWIAFSGQYEGYTDVYVMPAEGGEPRRLTYHPTADRAVGWTPDGKHVLFESNRHAPVRNGFAGQLFTVPVEGGFPDALPLPMAHDGCYSPDGKRLAYVPFRLPEWMAWKNYRGGTASPLWIAQLSDSSIDKVPRDKSNDYNPMWVGDEVFFLSDRDGPVNLFAYDTKTKKVRPVFDAKRHDFRSASAGPDALVLESFGALHLMDLGKEKLREVLVRIKADLPTVRPKFVPVVKNVRSAALSPTGARALFEARGEILTLPAEKGDARNVTNTPDAAERDPAWSPDGQKIAYFSDESGEYELHVRDQNGLGSPTKYTLSQSPSFYYAPVWSPDNKKIAYHDKRLHLWFLDLDTGKTTLVDTNPYDTPFRSFDPAWSPDGEWLAYTKQLKNHLHAVFVWSLKAKKAHRVTDGLSDARYPAFDKSGKYLFFTASTDVALTKGWLDMSSMNRPITRSVYVTVLAADQPSPLAPESDEEKADEKKPDGKDEKPKPAAPGSLPAVRLDPENIDQRILALPLPPRHYRSLATGKAGTIFLFEYTASPGWNPRAEPKFTLHKFDLEKRKEEKYVEGIAGGAVVSHNGEKVLYRQGEKWFLTAAATPPKPGEGALKLDGAEIRVDPRGEWRQMYHEIWRIQRDYLYDPGAHGLDLKAARKKYLPYLDGVGSRHALNDLFIEMLSDLSLGHVYVNGGDVLELKPVSVGLLGVDYQIEKDRYRFARIYRGENWNPDLKAPLTQPGVQVRQGEYLLAVNGKEVKAPDNVYRFFEGTANKAVVLRVGPSADGKDARDVTVVPVAGEGNLRHRAWIDDNRRKVEQLSDGKVGYVYLPNTSVEGFTSFNRYFFAQLDKEAVVLDERFNGGGSAADYIIDHLRRPLMNYWTTREGNDFTTPLGAIFGPKAMIVNEMAGSGGDLMPWMFRRAKLGPLVGKRTWGGLVGIYDYPQLIDGGSVTAPRLAFWNPEGEWEVENHGVAPDVEVEHDPQAVREGRDPQLEKAVELVLEELKKHPGKKPQRPAFPNYHKGK